MVPLRKLKLSSWELVAEQESKAGASETGFPGYQVAPHSGPYRCVQRTTNSRTQKAAEVVNKITVFCLFSLRYIVEPVLGQHLGTFPELPCYSGLASVEHISHLGVPHRKP
jgi:hypothetical protein